jgi:Na+/H+ antiporter NhaD/arsenite permease-like protein
MLLSVLDQIIRTTREVVDVILFAVLLMVIVLVFEGAHSWHARTARRRFGVHLGELPSRREQGRKAA